MSLVYQKFLAIGLPTVVAFLSILWLRNRRKGRRLLADSSAPDSLNNKENSNKKADLIDCVYEDTLTSDAVVSKVVSSSVSEQYMERFAHFRWFPIEGLDRPDNQTAVEGLMCSEVLSHISKEKENYCSSEELEEIAIKGIAADLDLVVKSSDVLDLSETSAEVSDSTKTPAKASDSSETPAENVDSAITPAEVLDSSEVSYLVLDFVKPPVQLVKDSEVSCSIIRTESGKNRIIGKIGMKKETEQIAEPINNLDLDKMKETGQLADKLASLELDQMKIDERKSGSERDSANHSPSEIMLASPSISNFSDAHSEGSSDSGKGQSDVAISPSRTPAGGSSLAGDQAPSVYEFVLPQIIVGRLIGRHGVFLNEIKTQTHTNIFIKRHPDSNKLKVCAIEGTQQDIDKALAKIRQKFPLRRFPQLTLEKVSFVQLNPLPPLKPEDFHLQLVEGVNNDVVLSSLVTAAHFFLQQPCHPSYASLTALNTIMTQIYSSGEAPALDAPVNFAVCAAPAMEGWYRAQIIQVEEDGLHCTIKYLDYGGYSRVAATDLRQIRGDLLALPFQAVECYLANVAPAGEDWTQEARLFVQSLTCGQILHAQVYDYAEDGAPLVYLYSSFGNQVVLINEQLVVNGFAVIAEQGSCCGTTSEDGGRTDEEATKSERDTE